VPHSAGPILIADVTAPVRIADAGGWTDTWFARRGVVCSLAVRPGAFARVYGGASSSAPMCTLDVQSFGHRYRFVVADPPGRHPLLESAIRRWAPANLDLTVEVGCAVPPGSGVGTSAAVSVALIAALLHARGDTVDRMTVARAAHAVETVDLGQQSGVQDQLAAAFGGALRIDVDAYPHASVRRLAVPAGARTELAERVLTVYLGRPHRSSEIHRAVIDDLEGDAVTAERLLAPLRATAEDAVAALEAGDVDSWADALSRNTAAQARLHAGLVPDRACAVISTAGAAGAIGWKVNGAGGDGGTVTLVAGEDPERLRTALLAAGCELLDLRPTDEGLVLAEP
jgi:D-glycero-alpha-D-manno-heptose-7-phosphate kinase